MQFQLSDVSGYYLLQPLTVLLEDLDYANLEIPHFHSPVFLENSYSAAAILLAVTMVESFTASVQYLLNSSGLPVVPFVQDKYPCSPLAEKIPEIFAVRHAIAHGHMWHREISIDMEAPRLLSYGSFELHEGFGHRKSFFQYVDLDVQRTKLLRINVTPTRLTKVDVAIVMKIVGEYLLFLDNEVSLELNRSPQSIINIANQYVMYRGRTAKFLDVLNTVHSESA